MKQDSQLSLFPLEIPAQSFFSPDDDDKLTLQRSTGGSVLSLRDYDINMEERDDCDSCCHLDSFLADVDTNDSNSILGRLNAFEQDDDVEFLEQEGLLFVFDSFKEVEKEDNKPKFDPFKIDMNDFYPTNDNESSMEESIFSGRSTKVSRKRSLVSDKMSFNNQVLRVMEGIGDICLNEFGLN